MHGILIVLAGTAMLAAAVALVLYGDAVVRGVGWLGRRAGVLPEPPPLPLAPPIDQLARDLRRLRLARTQHSPGESMVRRQAATAAYDEALAQALTALGLPDSLSALRAGTERDAERLRVEWLLEQEGLDLGPPA